MCKSENLLIRFSSNSKHDLVFSEATPAGARGYFLALRSGITPSDSGMPWLKRGLAMCMATTTLLSLQPLISLFNK